MLYNPEAQFCFNEAIYSLCNGRKYDPTTEKCESGAPAPVIFILTTGANPAVGGSILRNPNQITYAAETRVTVTAVASQGYKFVGWTSAVTSTHASITVTMNGNMELTAILEMEIPPPPQTYVVTVNGVVIGEYGVGMAVNIDAVTPPIGQQFEN